MVIYLCNHYVTSHKFLLPVYILYIYLALPEDIELHFAHAINISLHKSLSWNWKIGHKLSGCAIDWWDNDPAESEVTWPSVRLLCCAHRQMKWRITLYAADDRQGWSCTIHMKAPLFTFHLVISKLYPSPFIYLDDTLQTGRSPAPIWPSEIT